jgi:hypothetical protein
MEFIIYFFGGEFIAYVICVFIAARLKQNELAKQERNKDSSNGKNESRSTEPQVHPM